MGILGQITVVVLLGVGLTSLVYCIAKLTGMLADEAAHHHMTKDNCRQYAYGTFEQFLEEFNKRQWERDEAHPESFFGSDKVSYPRPNYIHAGVICFGGVGMLLRGGDYKKFVKWEKEHSLERRENEIPLWEDVKKEGV